MSKLPDHLRRALYLIPILFTLVSCTEPDDEEIIEDHSISNWHEYIGLYQSAAVSVATGAHFPSDNNQISYVYSHDQAIDGVETYIFAWDWLWQGKTVIYFAGIHDGAPIDVLVKAKENQLPESILTSLVSDGEKPSLGVYGEDYFWNVVVDVNLPFQSRIQDQHLERVDGNELPKTQGSINLLTYTNKSNCSLFWVNGKRQGLNTSDWKKRIRSIRNNIDSNNIAAFSDQLATLKSQDCRNEFYADIFEQLIKHEHEHFALDTRAPFLEKLLASDTTIDVGSLGYNENLCDAVGRSIVVQSYPDYVRKPAKLGPGNSSIELTKVLLAHSNFEQKRCGLWGSIEMLSQFDNTELLSSMIDIEQQYPFDDGFYDTHESAFQASARNGNYSAAKLLLDSMPDKAARYPSEFLVSAAESENEKVMDLVLERYVDIDPESKGYACHRAVVETLKTGSMENLEKLLSINCSVSFDKDRLSELYEAVFTYRPFSDKNYLALYNRLKKENAILRMVPKDDVFYLSANAMVSQTKWQRSLGQEQDITNKARFNEAMQTLISDAVNRFGNVDYKVSDHTLLMRAARATNVPATRLLLIKSSNPTLKNADEKTALDIAQANAIELHRSRRDLSSEDVVKGFVNRKKWRQQAVEVVRLLNGDTSLFDVYVY